VIKSVQIAGMEGAKNRQDGTTRELQYSDKGDFFRLRPKGRGRRASAKEVKRRACRSKPEGGSEQKKRGGVAGG